MFSDFVPSPFVRPVLSVPSRVLALTRSFWPHLLSLFVCRSRSRSVFRCRPACQQKLSDSRLVALDIFSHHSSPTTLSCPVSCSHNLTAPASGPIGLHSNPRNSAISTVSTSLSRSLVLLHRPALRDFRFQLFPPPRYQRADACSPSALSETRPGFLYPCLKHASLICLRAFSPSLTWTKRLARSSK